MADVREESNPLETPEEVIAENENEVQDDPYARTIEIKGMDDVGATDFSKWDLCTLSAMRNIEVEADFNSAYGEPVIQTHMFSLERHAAKVFTKEIFEMFRPYIIDAVWMKLLSTATLELEAKEVEAKEVSARQVKAVGHTRKSCPMAAEVEKFKKGRSAPNAYMDGDDYDDYGASHGDWGCSE
ncbi:hypothetical protein RIF29_16255 [Crotalaria pallida]|uniref:Uncharacterized protein n=1 Tax=Crotalaria pallida TaxID=3830 RepID=A0AAN9FIJ0_CROPI